MLLSLVAMNFWMMFFPEFITWVVKKQFMVWQEEIWELLCLEHSLQ